MTTKRYTLSKEERLSWKRYIDLLFEKGQSFVAFPLRVVYLPMEEEMPARASFLVRETRQRQGQESSDAWEPPERIERRKKENLRKEVKKRIRQIRTSKR